MDNLYTGLNDVLAKAAEVLKTTTEKAYEIMYKQGNVEIAKFVAIIIFFFIMLVILKTFLKTITAKTDNGKYIDWMQLDKDASMMITFICLGLGVIFPVIVVLCNTNEIIQIIFNRDYWIIQKVIEMVK